MLGMLLTFSGNFIGEFSSSLGKRMLEKKELSTYLYGMASYLFLAILFFLITRIGGESLVFGGGVAIFVIKCIFEIIQSEVQFRALKLAPRTTFTFLRVLTIPLLFVVDLVLGYTLTISQFIGVLLVTLSLVFMFSGKHISRNGFYLSLFSAINAVITISLFKYNITHFRSVAVEGCYTTILLSCYFVTRSYLLHGMDMFRLLWCPNVGLLVVSDGIASVLLSFAFQYGPASLILAMVRSSALLWSFLSGAFYFSESGMKRKFATLSVLVVAVFLMLP